VKLSLEDILKTLAWPLGLVAVFSAVMLLFGVELGMVLAIAGAMVGAQALISLLIDVLKWAGVIVEGAAGKWSAGLNLLGIVGIAVALAVDPSVDFPAIDSHLMIIAQFLTLVFGYIVQLVSTKRIHQFAVRGLGVQAFSHGYIGR
jgi:hypothetical protein